MFLHLLGQKNNVSAIVFLGGGVIGGVGGDHSRLHQLLPLMSDTLTYAKLHATLYATSR